MKIRWSVELLHRVAMEVKREVQLHLRAQDSKLVLEYCLQKVLEEEIEESPLHDAYKVYYAVASIALLAQYPSQAIHTVPKLEKMIKTLLLRNKVKPRKSLLAHVYAHVAQAISYFHSQQGQLQSALWESAIGFTMSQSGSDVLLDEQHFHYAQLLLEKGSAVSAAEIFKRLLETSERRSIRMHSALQRMRALRLGGFVEGPDPLLHLPEDLDSSFLGEHLEWERALARVPLEGPSVMVDWIRHTSPSGENLHLIIRHHLWIRAHRSTSLGAKSFRSSSLKRHALKMGIVDQRQKTALKVLELFEYLEDTEVSFDVRLTHAAQILELTEKLDIETRVLALAALLRWLMRSNQKHLALTVLEEYQALGLRLSQGRQADAFHFLEGEISASRFLDEMQASHVPSQSTLALSESTMKLTKALA